LCAELQDSYALLVADSGGELIHTPILPPETNSITRTGHFVLADDGGLAGEVSEDRGGDYAMRERGRMHNWDERQRTRYFEHWLGSSIQGFTLQSMDIQQADQLQKDVLIKYKFSTPQYAQSNAVHLLWCVPRVLGDISASVEHKPRHYPIKLEQTSRQTDHYEIEIPKDYKVDDIPDPVNVDVGFASYRSKIEVDGSKLRCPARFDLQKGFLGSASSAAIVAFPSARATWGQPPSAVQVSSARLFCSTCTVSSISRISTRLAPFLLGWEFGWRSAFRAAIDAFSSAPRHVGAAGFWVARRFQRCDSRFPVSTRFSA
jgi:hypothetical protein